MALLHHAVGLIQHQKIQPLQLGQVLGRAAAVLQVRHIISYIPPDSVPVMQHPHGSMLATNSLGAQTAVMGGKSLCWRFVDRNLLGCMFSDGCSN